MRIPFDFNNSNLSENARIKFSYNTPENQANVEISIDASEISVDDVLEAFEMFLGALGAHLPENVQVGFIEVDEEDDDDEGKEGTIKFTLDDDEEEDEDK